MSERGHSSPSDDTAPPTGAREGPWRPLFATLGVQTLATMAAYSLPAAAPAIGGALAVEPALVGVFISTVYGVGMFSAILSPMGINRFGATRVGQFAVLMTIFMLLAAASGSVVLLAASAVILGLGYGATAPIATRLIVPRASPTQLNLLLSIRQIGVPLGGVLSGLTVPPVLLAFGWQAALLVQIVPALALLLLLQVPRARWDADRDPPGAPRSLSGVQGALAPLRLLVTDPALRNLSLACFIYAGIQLCFIAFLVVHLHSTGVAGLVRAGQALAVFQVSGVVTRPIWGWLADHWLSARVLLIAQGFLMAGAALAAGQFDAGWSYPVVLLVCVVGGATASGFTGIAYGELARLGGTHRTEATALGAATMFMGVMVLPSLFGAAVAASGGYWISYAGVAVFAVIGACILLTSRPGHAPGALP